MSLLGKLVNGSRVGQVGPGDSCGQVRNIDPWGLRVKMTSLLTSSSTSAAAVGGVAGDSDGVVVVLRPAAATLAPVIAAAVGGAPSLLLVREYNITVSVR